MHLHCDVGTACGDFGVPLPLKCTDSRDLLVNNVQDEKTTLAQYIADAYGVDEKAEARHQLASLNASRLLLLKAMVHGVTSFVLLPSFALMMTLMRTTSADISNEQIRCYQ